MPLTETKVITATADPVDLVGSLGLVERSSYDLQLTADSQDHLRWRRGGNKPTDLHSGHVLANGETRTIVIGQADKLWVWATTDHEVSAAITPSGFRG